MVGLCGLEPQTLRLSGVRSNHLSYRPVETADLRPKPGELAERMERKGSKLA